jgi:ComF family protein
MLKSLVQWFSPYICCLCEHDTTNTQDLCSVCKAALPWIENRCYRCGLTLKSGLDSICCQSCIDLPPKFDRLCAIFNYELPVTRLITRLKFSGQLAYGRILGELLVEAVHSVWYTKKPLPQAVLPIPLHASRLRKRGFNQALELFWPLKKAGKIPVLLDACSRIRKTTSQAQLKKEHRKRNMRGVFRLDRQLPFEHIAIMDDVVTTGSTVNALSEVLKRETDVAQIDVWCIARA